MQWGGSTMDKQAFIIHQMPPGLNDLTQWCWLSLDITGMWQKTPRWTTGMRDCKNWLYAWVALGDVLYRVSCNLDAKTGSNTTGISHRLRYWASLQHWLFLRLSSVMHFLYAMCQKKPRLLDWLLLWVLFSNLAHEVLLMKLSYCFPYFSKMTQWINYTCRVQFKVQFKYFWEYIFFGSLLFVEGIHMTSFCTLIFDKYL